MTDPDKVHIVCVFYHAAIRAASKAIPNHGNMVRPLVTRAGLAVDHMMPLPLTEMIGLPLVFKAARLNPAFHNLAQRYWCFDPTSSDHHDPNLTLARLSTVVDPLSPELGMPEYEANCEVMLARADGKDLHSAHVQSMDIFIEQRFARLFELAAKDDMEGMKAELEKVMVGLRKVCQNHVFSLELLTDEFHPGLRDLLQKAAKRKALRTQRPELDRPVLPGQTGDANM